MSLFFFYAVFIVCVVSHYDTETNICGIGG